nr:MAG TPA: hypothetical protein [Bacteriophage sp.]
MFSVKNNIYECFLIIKLFINNDENQTFIGLNPIFF